MYALCKLEDEHVSVQSSVLNGLETSHYHWGQFQTHAFHVVPSSMGLIVSFVTLHSQQY